MSTLLVHELGGGKVAGIECLPAEPWHDSDPFNHAQIEHPELGKDHNFDTALSRAPYYRDALVRHAEGRALKIAANPVMVRAVVAECPALMTWFRVTRPLADIALNLIDCTRDPRAGRGWFDVLRLRGFELEECRELERLVSDEILSPFESSVGYPIAPIARHLIDALHAGEEILAGLDLVMPVFEYDALIWSFEPLWVWLEEQGYTIDRTRLDKFRTDPHPRQYRLEKLARRDTDDWQRLRAYECSLNVNRRRRTFTDIVASARKSPGKL